MEKDKIYIIDKTERVHEVWKYVVSGDGEISVWSNTWYGRHILGVDCNIYAQQSPLSLVVELAGVLDMLHSGSQEEGVSYETWARNMAYLALSKAQQYLPKNR